jgi:hypothetical protein
MPVDALQAKDLQRSTGCTITVAVSGLVGGGPLTHPSHIGRDVSSGVFSKVSAGVQNKRILTVLAARGPAQAAPCSGQPAQQAHGADCPEQCHICADAIKVGAWALFRQCG